MLFNDLVHQDPPEKEEEVAPVNQITDGGGTLTAAIAIAAQLSLFDGPYAIGVLVVAGAAIYDATQRVYLTYTLTNAQGKIYVDRTSGFGDPLSIMHRRFASHNMRPIGYGNPRLDVAAQGLTGRYAIRGREQQLIDFYGGVGSSKVGNSIRGVSRSSPAGRGFHLLSNQYFGPLAPYTGY